MRLWILRKLYGFIYWFGQIEPESDITYGYYRKFRKPETVPDAELVTEIQRLGAAIQNASD